MIIDLINLEGSSHPFEFSIPADEIDLGTENVRLLSDVSAVGTVTKHIVQTDVEGTIRADAEIDCTRCLNPVAAPLDITFDVSFVTEDNFTAEKETALDADDLETDVFGGDKLDLKELVREQVLLDLPGQLFCREDCKGLCQKCGANRNLIDCKCEETETDPRWAALKDFRS
jgi:uncharacterized protein